MWIRNTGNYTEESGRPITSIRFTAVFLDPYSVPIRIRMQVQYLSLQKRINKLKDTGYVFQMAPCDIKLRYLYIFIIHYFF